MLVRYRFLCSVVVCHTITRVLVGNKCRDSMKIFWILKKFVQKYQTFHITPGLAKFVLIVILHRIVPVFFFVFERRCVRAKHFVTFESYEGHLKSAQLRTPRTNHSYLPSLLRNVDLDNTECTVRYWPPFLNILFSASPFESSHPKVVAARTHFARHPHVSSTFHSFCSLSFSPPFDVVSLEECYSWIPWSCDFYLSKLNRHSPSHDSFPMPWYSLSRLSISERTCVRALVFECCSIDWNKLELVSDTVIFEGFDTVIFEGCD